MERGSDAAEQRIQRVEQTINAVGDKVRSTFQNTWNYGATVAASALDNISRSFSSQYQNLLSTIRMVPQAFQRAFDTIRTGAVSLQQGLGTVWGSISRAGASALEMIGKSVGTVLRTIPVLSNQIGSALKNVGQASMTALSSGLSGLLGTLSNAYKNSPIPTFFDAFRNAAVSTFNYVQASSLSMWNTIRDFTSTGLQSIRSAISSSFSSVTSVVSDALSGIGNVAQKAFQGISVAAQNGWNATKASTMAAAATVSSLINTAWTEITSHVSNAMTSIQNVASNAWTAVHQQASRALGGIQNVASTAWGSIQTGARALGTYIQNTWQGIGQTVSLAGSYIRNSFTGVIDSLNRTYLGFRLVTAATSSLAALGAGFSQTFDSVRSVFSNLGQYSATAFSNVRAGFSSSLSAMQTGLGNFSSSLSGIWTNISNAGVNAFAKIQNAMPKGMQNLIQGLALQAPHIGAAIAANQANNTPAALQAMGLAARGTFGVVQQAAQDLLQGIKGVWGQIPVGLAAPLSAVVSSFQTTFANIKTSVGNVWQTLTGMDMKNAFAQIRSGFRQIGLASRDSIATVQAFFTSLKSTMASNKSLTGSNVGILSDLPILFNNAFKSIQLQAQTFVNGLGTVFSGIKNVASTAAQAFQPLMASFQSTGVGSALTSGLQGLGSMFAPILTQAKTAMGGLQGYLSGAWQQVATVGNNALQQLSGYANNAWTSIQFGAMRMHNSLIGGWSPTISNWQGFMNNMSSTFGSFINNIISQVPNFVNNFNEGLQEIHRGLESLSGQALHTGFELSQFITLPIAGLIKMGIAYDDVREISRVSFDSMLHDSKKSEQMIRDMEQLSRVTVFQPGPLMQLGNRMMQLGIETKKVIPYLKAASDAAALMGGGEQNVERAVNAMVKVKETDRFTLGTMNQVSQATGIPAFKILAEYYNKSEADFRKLVMQGAVAGEKTVDEAINVLFHAMEKHAPKGSDKLNATLLANLSNVKESITTTLGVGLKGTYQQAAALSQKVQDALAVVRDSIYKLEETAGGKEKLDRFVKTILSLASIGPVVVAFGALAKVLALVTAPMGILGFAIGAAMNYLLQNKDAAKGLADAFMTLKGGAQQLANEGMRLFGTTGKEVVEMLKSMAGPIGRVIDFASSLLHAFNALPEHTQKLIFQFAAAAGAMAIFGQKGSVVAATLYVLAPVIERILAWFSKLSPQTQDLIIKFAIIVLSIAKVGAAFNSMGISGSTAASAVMTSMQTLMKFLGTSLMPVLTSVGTTIAGWATSALSSGSAIVAALNPVTVGAALMVASQGEAGHRGADTIQVGRRPIDYQLRTAQKALADTQSAYDEWHALPNSEARRKYVGDKFGTNALTGGLNKDRDEYNSDLNKWLDQAKKKVAELQVAAQNLDIGPVMMRNIAASISTPQGVASCALFASKMMQNLGQNIPTNASATGIRDYMKSQGAEHFTNPALARPGDYVYYTGPRMGTSRDAQGNGHHAAVYEGNGMVYDSSNGISHESPLQKGGGSSFEFYRLLSNVDSAMNSIARSTGALNYLNAPAKSPVALEVKGSAFGGPEDRRLWDRNVRDAHGNRQGDPGNTASAIVNTGQFEHGNWVALPDAIAKAARLRFGDIVRVTDKQTGLTTAGPYVDSGPSPSTGRKVDMSPDMMKAVHGDTDHVFDVFTTGIHLTAKQIQDQTKALNANHGAILNGNAIGRTAAETAKRIADVYRDMIANQHRLSQSLPPEDRTRIQGYVENARKELASLDPKKYGSLNPDPYAIPWDKNHGVLDAPTKDKESPAQKAIDSMKEKRDQFGERTELERTNYAIEAGAYEGITAAQAKVLRGYAEQVDALERVKNQVNTFKESLASLMTKNADLRKSIELGTHATELQALAYEFAQTAFSGMDRDQAKALQLAQQYTLEMARQVEFLKSVADLDTKIRLNRVTKMGSGGLPVRDTNKLEAIQQAGGQEQWNEKTPGQQTAISGMLAWQRQQEAYLSAGEAAATLHDEMMSLGDATTKAAIAAVKGADNWKLLDTQTQNIVRSAVQLNSTMTSLQGMSDNYSEQLMDAVSTSTKKMLTESDKAEAAIRRLTDKNGVSEDNPIFTKQIQQIRQIATELDKVQGNKAYTQMRDSYKNSADDINAKIAGTFDPDAARRRDFAESKRNDAGWNQMTPEQHTGILNNEQWQYDQARMLEGLTYSREALQTVQLKMNSLSETDPFQKSLTSLMKFNAETQRFEMPKGLDIEALKQAHDIELQYQGMVKLNGMTGELAKRAEIMKASNPFEAWLASMYEVDQETGKIKLPAGFNTKEGKAKLRDIFDTTQSMNMMEQFAKGVTDLFGNMFTDLREKGFKGLFQGILKGFSDLLFKMGVEWLQSKLMTMMQSGIASILGIGKGPAANNSANSSGRSEGASAIGNSPGLLDFAPSLMGIFGGAGGAGGMGGAGGAGGILQSTVGIAGSIGGLFGKAASNMQDITTMTTDSVSSSLENLASGHFAQGGSAVGGKAAWVGERGPELVVPKEDSTVVNNDTISRMINEQSGGNSSRSSSSVNHYHINVNTNDPAKFRSASANTVADIQRMADHKRNRTK